MAEPYHDTSSFSINVVLASHQSKHSYAVLLVHIYIHNVSSLILSFYLGSAPCAPFLTQSFFSAPPLTWPLPVLFLTVIPELGPSLIILKSLVPTAEWTSLEVQPDAWSSYGGSVNYCWRRHFLSAGESKPSPLVSCSKHLESEVSLENCLKGPWKEIIWDRCV